MKTVALAIVALAAAASLAACSKPKEAAPASGKSVV